MSVQSCTQTCAEASGLTRGVASPCPSGLVPDSQAVVQEAEMPLLLPRTGLDLSQSRPCHHHLHICVILDTCEDHDYMIPLLLHQNWQARGRV